MSIDETQFLPRRTSIVNPCRMAKGDITGTVEMRRVGDRQEKSITTACVEDTTVVAELVNMGYLESHHPPHGFALLELRGAFLAPLQHKINLISDIVGRGVSHRSAAQMYLEIAGQLGADGVRIIQYACEAPATSKDSGLDVIAAIQVYIDCFEKLSRLLDAQRDRIREEEEKNSCKY